MDGDDTKAIESVLKADKERAALLAEMAELRSGDETDEKCLRLTKIYDQLVAIDADSAPARAATIMHGLGFDNQMLVCSFWFW